MPFRFNPHDSSGIIAAKVWRFRNVADQIVGWNIFTGQEKAQRSEKSADKRPNIHGAQMRADHGCLKHPKR